MTKRILFLLAISSIFWSCGEESEPEDCAGIPGGDTVCGCTDSTATNFDRIRTYDGDESWCVQKTSDDGFIISGASNYSGLLIKTDCDGEKEWHQIYENSTSLYGIRFDQ